MNMVQDSIIRVLTSPVRFFEARIQMRPNWIIATAPVLAQCALAAATGIVVTNKGQAAMTAALVHLREGNAGDLGVGMISTVVSAISVLFNVLGTMGFFAISVGALILLDLLFAQSGRARRLVEFTAYSYLPTVVWSAVTLAVLLFWWAPPELRVPSSASMQDMQSAVTAYQANLASTPIQLTLRIVSSYFWAWQIAIQAAALRVVSGFSVLGAWAAGIALISVFVVLPWVVAATVG